MGKDSEEPEPPNRDLEARILSKKFEIREIPPFKEPEKPKGEHEVYCTCESCLRRREGLEVDETYARILERKAELNPKESPKEKYPLKGDVNVSPILYHPSRFGYPMITKDKSSTNPESDTAEIGYKKSTHPFTFKMPPQKY